MLNNRFSESVPSNTFYATVSESNIFLNIFTDQDKLYFRCLRSMALITEVSGFEVSKLLQCYVYTVLIDYPHF